MLTYNYSTARGNRQKTRSITSAWRGPRARRGHGGLRIHRGVGFSPLATRSRAAVPPDAAPALGAWRPAAALARALHAAARASWASVTCMHTRVCPPLKAQRARACRRAVPSSGVAGRSDLAPRHGPSAPAAALSPNKHASPSPPCTLLQDVDERRLRMLIRKRKLAPCHPGQAVDGEAGDAAVRAGMPLMAVRAPDCMPPQARRLPCLWPASHLQAHGTHPTTISTLLSHSLQVDECPICMLNFPALNQTVCCKSLICTECFVEVQCVSKPPGKASCPYCKSHPLTVKVGGTPGQQKPCSSKQPNEGDFGSRVAKPRPPLRNASWATC
jgi:hypothetical protein